MPTSRPSGDGYNPVINAMGVEPFTYSTWHSIFPLCGIAGKSANAQDLHRGVLCQRTCHKSLSSVTERRGWHKIFPLCSKAKIAVLCHCMYDQL